MFHHCFIWRHRRVLDSASLMSDLIQAIVLHGRTPSSDGKFVCGLVPCISPLFIPVAIAWFVNLPLYSIQINPGFGYMEDCADEVISMRITRLSR